RGHAGVRGEDRGPGAAGGQDRARARAHREHGRAEADRQREIGLVAPAAAPRPGPFGPGYFDAGASPRPFFRSRMTEPSSAPMRPSPPVSPLTMTSGTMRTLR